LSQIPIQGISKAILTINSENGSATPYNRKTVPIKILESGVLIEDITLVPGNYKLADFHLLNSNGIILYATPMDGSPYGKTLEQPLPLAFEMHPAGKSEIEVGVFSTADETPEMFGFDTDMEGFVETFYFYISVKGNESKKQEENLPSTLSVNSGQYSMTQNLDGDLNIIVLPKSLETFDLTVESNSFYPWKNTFSSEILRQYRDEPLLIELKKGLEEIEYVGGTFEGWLNLSTQYKVDSFARKGYETIQGGLIIGRTPKEESDPVTDLSGLNTLKSIVGSLDLEGNPKLTSLVGLQNLEVISERLSFQNNPLLENMDGFLKLTQLKDLWLINNPNLRNLDGIRSGKKQMLSSLLIQEMEQFEFMEVGEYNGLIRLTISANPNLKKILFNYPQPKGISFVTISDNPELTDFGKSSGNGFNEISTLRLENNRKLDDLNGIVSKEGNVRRRIDFINNPNIETLQDINFHEYFSEINIRDNESLKDLKTFSNLTVLFSRITLVNNPLIQSLEGLENISQVVYTETPMGNHPGITFPPPVLFRITDNASLNDFCAFHEPIAKFDKEFSRIENNAFNPSHEDLSKGRCKE
jgi:hypothetical protein